MSYEGRQFLESCGATGPLRFELAGPTTGDSCNWEIKRAAFVAGRDPAADLVLDDPSVAPFQAFFQVVDGWLFGFDLTAGDGIRWGEIPRLAGWVKRGQKLRIGQHTIRLVGGDREPGESIVEPAPTSTRYANRLNLPRVVLEFRHAAAGKDGPSKRDVLDRVLVLAGRSERCKLKVEGNDVAQFACALLRTPSGLWMTNIQPGQGARINGALCRFARIEDDDKLQLGQFHIRVIYNDNPKPRSSNHHTDSQALTSR